jgi:benzoyl-CoA reductase/2-hydroxyglutaryl-CoA dehydratase subunit BcrC/BadD/HgdB
LFKMYFLLFGAKDYKDRLGYVVNTCPDCGMRGLFTVEQARKNFTVYLIPAFEYSRKQYMTCQYCHEVFEVADEIKEELAAKLISQEELTDAIKKGRLNNLLIEPNNNSDPE